MICEDDDFVLLLAAVKEGKRKKDHKCKKIPCIPYIWDFWRQKQPPYFHLP